MRRNKKQKKKKPKPKNRKKRKRCFYCLDEEIYRCFSSPLVPHSFSFFFSFPSSPYSFCFCYLGLFFFFIFLFCFVFYRYRLGERKRPTLFGSFFLLLKFFFWFFFGCYDSRFRFLFITERNYCIPSFTYLFAKVLADWLTYFIFWLHAIAL